MGEVVNVEEVEGSEKLFKLTVDFGDELGIKTIFSGIRKWYNTTSLLNKKFIFCVNLAPIEFKFGVSEGMILGAGDQEASLCILDKELTSGTAIK
ncbi:hypothetical protein HY310_01470 [Candidatus Microgenomates bacterium]|nr:hypothetical protein [Candidatus Microgenomates bacterium]